MTTGESLVIDASALLAMVHGEPGGDAVRPLMAGSIISSVNWSEVVQKSAASGVDIDGMRAEVREIGLTISPFTALDAEEAARLWFETRHIGLSFADRACLAVARRRRAVAVTADRAWAALPIDVPVQLIR